MAFIEKNSDGVFTGATPVTLVAAPASGLRRVVTSIIIANVDTAGVTLTVRFNRAAGTIRRIEPAYPMPANGVWILPKTIVLDATDEVIEGLLAGAVSANEPEFVSSFADVQ